MMGIVQMVIVTFVLAIAMKLVEKLFSKVIPVPDLLESVVDFGKYWRDFSVLVLYWGRRKKEGDKRWEKNGISI